VSDIGYVMDNALSSIGSLSQNVYGVNKPQVVYDPERVYFAIMTG